MTHTLHDTDTGRHRYEALDALRAYAAIGIVLMHVLANTAVKPASNFLTAQLIPWFTDFTLLFMVISGFSVSCGYFHKIKTGAITPARFYGKRYIRLLPFYALMCLIALIQSPSLRSLAETFSDVTLTNGLIPEVELNIIGVGWFMGVVMLYYIFFPFIVFLQDTGKKAVITLLCSILLVWISLEYSAGTPAIGRRYIVYCLPLFLAGGTIFMFKERLSRVSRRYSPLFLIAAVALTSLPFVNPYKSVFASLLISIVLFTSWLIYCIGLQINNKSGGVIWKATEYIGSLSLEIYLSHMMIFRIVEFMHLDRFIHNPNLHYTATCVMVISGAIIFSHIAKHHIINPALKKLKL